MREKGSAQTTIKGLRMIIEGKKRRSRKTWEKGIKEHMRTQDVIGERWFLGFSRWKN